MTQLQVSSIIETKRLPKTSQCDNFPLYNHNLKQQLIGDLAVTVSVPAVVITSTLFSEVSTTVFTFSALQLL